MPSTGDIAEKPCTGSCEGTKGHGQQAGVQVAKAKIGDDNSSECLQAAIGNVDCDVEYEDQPNLRIEKRLPDLVPFPDLVMDASPI